MLSSRERSPTLNFQTPIVFRLKKIQLKWISTETNIIDFKKNFLMLQQNDNLKQTIYKSNNNNDDNGPGHNNIKSTNSQPKSNNQQESTIYIEAENSYEQKCHV